jgi:TPR repeat protein
LTVPPTASETATSTSTSTPPPSAPVRASAATPDQPDVSDIQRQALLSRGDAFFSAGDITSARLFYQRGADAGDGSAALRLGETYDAAFLQRAHSGGVRSDLEKAVYWYRRARDLGSAEAEILLKSLR